MIDHSRQGNRDASIPSWHRRKLLQATTSSTLNSSQASFIALICVIGVLSLAIVIMVIFLCCRYHSFKGKKYKPPKKYPQVLSYPENHLPSAVPISVTPSSASPYTNRSDDRLISKRPPPRSSVSTSPSRRQQNSTMDAYLNDQNIYEPVTLDPQHLNSFLFVDLHSTSSETFPETYSRHMMQHHPPNTNNTTTSGYHTSIGDEQGRRQRLANGLPHRSWRRPTLSDVKSSNKSRFVMRERSLPNTLSRLPQLRQQIVQTENSLTTVNPELLSTDLSLTTDDYDDSHAYHVHQKDEEAPTPFHPHFHRPRSPHLLYQDQKQHLFEVVSIYRGDDSDMPVPPPSQATSIATGGQGTAFVNQSILV